VPAKFFWFLPTNGDSRSIVGASHASSHHAIPEGYRAPSRRYLAEIGRAADRLGYQGVLTPTGTWCEDASLTASALLAETERLKFLVAFRPGQYYTIKDGRVSEPPNPLPEFYFGGSSAAALPIATEHVDVYLTWGEPPQAAAAKIKQVRELAERRGRNLRFGIRLHTITRDTSAAAWAVAGELVKELTPEQIEQATKPHATSESEGQRRMTALHGGQIDKLEIYPNLWAGVGLVRGGAGTALVGSHQEVANLIWEYHSLGFDEFILSGYPHLEEAYWFAEGVLPILRAKGVLAT